MWTFLLPCIPDGMGLACNPAQVFFEAACKELLVEIFERSTLWGRNQKVATAVANARLDLPLLVSLTDRAEMRGEEVVTAKSHKGSNLLSCTHCSACLLKGQFYGCSQIIVADAVGNSSKVLEGLHVCPLEAFLFLGGEGH